jgi:chemotaxis family two-component system sensor kinase Cph1
VIAQIAMPAAADIESCHSEPIQIPGAIQPHGVLIAANKIDRRVTHVSENFAASTGISARLAIGSLLTELIGIEAMAEVSNALASERYAPANVLTLKLPFKRQRERNVVVHTHDGRIILELEETSSTNQGHLVARVQAIMETLREVNSIAGLCEHVSQALRALTGYDRVMIYRFDARGDGEVVAEDCRSDLESYLNLRYPASDIPAQARSLYLKQRVRTIVDVNYRPVAILADDTDVIGKPLDMSYCGLRSVSSIHVEYLRNMGVGATLAVSLIRDEQLWGMIVCHHLTAHSVPADVKAICDLLGQLFMLLIDKATEREETERLIQRQNALAEIKQSVQRAASIGEGLAEAAAALLGLVTATGAAIRLNGQVRLFGVTSSVEETDALMTQLNSSAENDLIALSSISESYPQLAAVAAIASGALFLPILNNPGDAIVWFRPELVKTVLWAGDPNKAAHVEHSTDRLSPRKSFAAWRELLKGTSAPWTKAETRAAHDLGRIVTVGLLHHAEARLMRLSEEEEEERSKAMAKIDRAKSIFFANVSHEFRTPLTLMLAPLGDALNDTSGTSLPAPQRQRIEVAYRNSLRLLRLVNTLLDFSQIETGHVEANCKPTDLATVTAELAAGFRPAIDRAGLSLDIDCPTLPHLLNVDREIWEKVVLNLLSNAFKFTFNGGISVKLRAEGAYTELSIRDTGVGISAEEIPRLFERFHRIEGQRSRSFEGSGIGLALVHDLVQLQGGTVEASSEPDVGTVFIVRVPFKVANLPQEASDE